MSIWQLAIAVWSTAMCTAWCILNALAARALARVSLFERELAPDPPVWPRVSIIIAACNEADTIEPAVRTLLAQEYRDFEVIVVNDRSTDNTGAIIDRLAASDARVRAVHVTELPAGWLGKVHALQTGIQQANGEWLLFTDADVHFAHGALVRAVALALARGADHVALMPGGRSGLLWLDTVLATFAIGFVLISSPTAAGSRHARVPIGSGGFNLVRRAALERTEGFAWLRMETADDLGLGLMLRRAGAKLLFALAFEHARVMWYPTLRAMFRGFEKNTPGLVQYSAARLAAATAFVASLVLAPFVSLLPGMPPWAVTAGMVALLAVVPSAVVWRVRLRQPFVPALLAPAGNLLLGAMVVRAAVLCLWRGGVVWRGTRYDIKELRTGQRVRF